MHDIDTKNLLPIQIILGASDFAKIKMGTCPRVDQIGEPFAEQLKMGWVIMLPDRESDIVSALFTKTFVNDHEKLYDTDVLGLKESHYKIDDYVYDKFKKQLKRDKEGWCETGLAQKEGNLPLGNNRNESSGRLKSLVRSLKRDSEIHKAYDTVIQEQIQIKVIERVSNNGISNCKELYLPHKPVIQKKS